MSYQRQSRGRKSPYTFTHVESPSIPRSKFDLSFNHKTTMNEGFLVPFVVEEILPGDSFNISATVVTRVSPLIKPLLDDIFYDIYYFVVPLRLVWDDFKEFMGEQVDDDGVNEELLVPQYSQDKGFPLFELPAYMGMPTYQPHLPMNALYLRAYNLIYREWFRDQNLQSVTPVPTDSNNLEESSSITPDTVFRLRRKNKRKDYFTSCLPFPQKGEPVFLPLGDAAPVRDKAPLGTVSSIIQPNQTDSWVGSQTMDGFETVSGDTNVKSDASDPAGWYGVNFDNRDSLVYTDLTSASALTINDLRLAVQIQKLLERDARGGTRYTELVSAHFGVTSLDARQQRPEYIGGGSDVITITATAQTSIPAGDTPQGNLAGIGFGGHTKNRGVYASTEHAILIGLICYSGNITYQQGVPRKFSRRQRYDYYYPELAHLGEQAVLNKEIYAVGQTDIDTPNAQNEEVFGYQERWAEYRFGKDIITGELLSGWETPQDVWHLSQYFTSLPTLSETFIEQNAPMSRVLALPNDNHFYADIRVNQYWTRPMPTFSTPGFMDHF